MSPANTTTSMAANYKQQLAALVTSGGFHKDQAEKYGTFSFFFVEKEFFFLHNEHSFSFFTCHRCRFRAILEGILKLDEEGLIDGLKVLIESSRCNQSARGLTESQPFVACLFSAKNFSRRSSPHHTLIVQSFGVGDLLSHFVS